MRGGLASLRSARFLLHVALWCRWYHIALLSLLELLAGLGEGLSLRLLLRQPHHHGHLQPLLLLVHLLELLKGKRAQVHHERLLLLLARLESLAGNGLWVTRRLIVTRREVRIGCLWRKHLHLIHEHHLLVVLLLHHRLRSHHRVASHHLPLELLLHFILTWIDAACLVVVA